MKAESIVIFVVLSSSSVAIVAGYAQGRCVTPRRWIAPILTLFFIAAVALGMLAGLESLLQYKTLWSAAAFLIGLVGPTAVILIGIPVVRRWVSRRGAAEGSLGPVERIFFSSTPFGSGQIVIPLGKPASQISVSDGPQALTLELPARRSRRTWLLGLGALALLILPLYTLVATLVGSALLISDGAVLAGFLFILLGVLAAVLRNLPWLLVSVWGWYVLFGVETAVIRDDRATLRKSL